MRSLVTSLGESLIDFLPIVEEEQTRGFRVYPGGSPLNVAVGLRRLGLPVAFASKLSTDLFGRTLRAAMVAEGIETRFLVATDAPTTLAFVAIEDGEPAYAFYGEGAADTLLEARELEETLYAETHVLHVGSISLLRGVTASAIVSVAERFAAEVAQQANGMLSFDPNICPSLVSDGAEYRATLQRIFTLADVVKVSAADLAWWSPGREPLEVARDLLGLGAALVVVTLGMQGALALSEHAPDGVFVPVLPVTVVDTVGAGDAFCSALLAALLERGVSTRATLRALTAETLTEVLRFASVGAALACTHAGAHPPRREEIMARLAQGR